MNVRRDVRIHDPSPAPPHIQQTPNAHPAAISPAVQPSNVPAQQNSILHKLSHANEQTWLLIGRVAEQMNDHEHALSAYENALRHNPMSLVSLGSKKNYPKAIDYFQRVLSLQEENGEVWSALGHCYLMQDDLQKAYSAYQQALYLLPNPKEDPKLWYGIGILYDRYGSLDHAEEAFSSVLRMDKVLGLDFDKSNEILFRLGIIYKQQGKYDDSLSCFDRILRNPPNPLAHADIWFQIGHVYEQQKDSKDAYERVVLENPNHAKVLQQLGWLYHQDGSSFQNQDLAIQYLTKSLEADPSDAQSWYLLDGLHGRLQVQQGVRGVSSKLSIVTVCNPTSTSAATPLTPTPALSASSPYISEVWFDLGCLYESCNNQITDAIDAYARASELDPANPRHHPAPATPEAGTGRWWPASLLRRVPRMFHPTAYASAVVPPPGLNGPLMLHGGNRNAMRADSRGPSSNEISLPPAQLGNGRASSPPFRGGPPPPVNIDESRHPSSSHPPLAPMEVDRPPTHSRDYPPPRDGPGRGPSGHQSILLNHGPPPPPGPSDDMRNGHPPMHDPFYNRARPPRSHSNSPAPHSARPRSPGQHSFNYPPPRQHVGPGQSNNGPPQRSPRMYTNEHGRPPMEVENAWDRERRGPPPPINDQREWERERERDRRPRNSGEFAPPHPGQGMYPQHSPSMGHRPHSPPQPSPRSQPGRFWESKPATAPPSAHMQHRASPPPPGPSRYDPARFGGREREYDVPADRGYPPSPENARSGRPQGFAPGPRRSESPHPSQSVEAKTRRRVMRDNKELEIQPHPQQGQVMQSQLPPPSHIVPSHSSTPIIQDPNTRKRRKNLSNKRKDDGGSETPKPEQQHRSSSFKVMQQYDQASNGSSSSSERGSFKVMQSPDPNAPNDRERYKLMQPPYAPKGPSSPDDRQGFKHSSGYGSFKGSPEPAPPPPSSSSSRSVQPSPTSAAPRPPVRAIDEDYDEGVDALMGLAQQGYRVGPPPAHDVTPGSERPAPSPAISPRSRGQPEPSPRPPPSHRNSVSSTLSHASPASQAAQLKRPRSDESDESEHSKRSRTDGSGSGSGSSAGGMDNRRRRSSMSGGRMTPVQSTRPSPIPFRTQPASHSPEARNASVQEMYDAREGRAERVSPPLGSVVLPPHPRPVGNASAGGREREGSGMALPPIATLSPPASPRDERMAVDERERGGRGTGSPPMGLGMGRKEGRGVSRTPPTGVKHTPSPPMDSKKEQ
ncbi:TPR-containing protein Mql1 [Ephemerocybe angulata]|uniref:TPR-containing protein Mql1 n=1 Tax=Ephemerocybe angulata TaxID=980116 RepID=A0A8H6IK98_9AGAR|nr:TPR-containing protein Mql1 [Tulosesus angulatus]